MWKWIILLHELHFFQEIWMHIYYSVVGKDYDMIWGISKHTWIQKQQNRYNIQHNITIQKYNLVSIATEWISYRIALTGDMSPYQYCVSIWVKIQRAENQIQSIEGCGITNSGPPMAPQAEFKLIELKHIDQGCQTESPGDCSVCRFLWFPFNQLSIKALKTKRVDSLANQCLNWTMGAEDIPKTSRHSGPQGLKSDTGDIDSNMASCYINSWSITLFSKKVASKYYCNTWLMC